jgi:hypothetical protein
VTTPTRTNHGLSYPGVSSFIDILIQLSCLSDYQDFAPQLLNQNPPIAAYGFSPALSNNPGNPGTPLSSFYSSYILPTPYSQHQAASRSPLMNTTNFSFVNCNDQTLTGNQKHSGRGVKRNMANSGNSANKRARTSSAPCPDPSSPQQIIPHSESAPPSYVNPCVAPIDTQTASSSTPR